jgi:uncharacterized membrane protein YedE/YeeE
MRHEGANRAGLLLGALGTAVVLAALPGPGQIPTLLAAMLTGAAFVWLDFGFTGGFRAFLGQGDGRALGAAFIVPAVAALVVLPGGVLLPGHGRFIAPVGLSLLLGAAMFGVGMQLANGCGSGTLVAAGQGSRRMGVALPFFCLGGVLGSLALPTALRWPELGAIDLAEALGPWGALLAAEALLLAMALVVLRGARPEPARLRAGAIIGALAALLFLLSGEPWGITMGLTLWGAKLAQAAGLPLAGSEFWSVPWAAEALAGPVLGFTASLTNAGLLLGSLLAAAWGGGLRWGTPLGWRGTLGAALGGLLMGVGARLGFGCNVGAFVGGVSSGSLHGFMWFVAMLPGCWLGMRLRPRFGLG